MTREEAIKKLQKQKARYLEEFLDFTGVSEAYDMAIEALQAETKHGKWLQKRNSDDTGSWVWKECSECGNAPLLNRYNKEEVTSQYCSYCGAKMDKGGDTE